MQHPPPASRLGVQHRRSTTATYEFFSTETFADPYPLFDRLRRDDPVYRAETGYWYVSRYADANALLRDGRLQAGSGVADSFGLTEGPLHTIMTSWLMSLDGSAHSRVRRLLARAFTPRAVAALRPRVEAVADKLVGDLVDAGGGDLMTGLAFPLPMEVVRVLFGADADEWDAEVVALFDPKRRADGGFLRPMQGLADYFTRLVPARRSAPGDDIFSGLLGADEHGDILSDEELVANGVLLVTAGFETTMSLIALAVLTLLRHPDQLARLIADPGLSANAVDEVLRYEPAALSTTRSTPVDLTVAGRMIPAGSNILFSVVAANRDPERYRDPEVFDITRTDIRPLTFGGGVHNCIGAALARMETDVALRSLFGRVPGLALATTSVSWQTDNPTVRRPLELLVRA